MANTDSKDQWPRVVLFQLPADQGLPISHQHLKNITSPSPPFIVPLSSTLEMLGLVTSHFIYSGLCPCAQFWGPWVKLLPSLAPALHPLSPQFFCIKGLWFSCSMHSEKSRLFLLLVFYSLGFSAKEAMLVDRWALPRKYISIKPHPLSILYLIYFLSIGFVQGTVLEGNIKRNEINCIFLELS